MKARTLLFGLLAPVAVFMAPSPVRAAPPELAAISPPPLPTNRRSGDLDFAFKHLKAAEWRSAQTRADRLGDPVASKLLNWFVLTDSRSRPEFSDIAVFVEANPEWPRRDYLLARAENLLIENSDHDTVLSWFAKQPPLTTAGKVRLGEALLANGRSDEGAQLVRSTWINGVFSRSDESQFQRIHSKRITSNDNLARLDKLLWDGDRRAAQRMLWRISGDDRLLGQARLLLRLRSGNVDTAVAKVPATLRNDPGLVYERLRWRRIMGRDLDAVALLADQPDDLVRPELWQREKAILARRLLEDGFISEAYRVVSDHRMQSGIGFADSEWLAGWIALRFLKDDDIAFEHFVRMHDGVSYPISLARAAYWAGRAAEAMGNATQQRRWYLEAAGHPTTYYGQLAAARLQTGIRIALPAAPVIDDATNARFAANELARATSLLVATGQDNNLPAFFRALGNAESKPAWRKLTAGLAHAAGRPDLAIRVAKDGAPDGIVLIDEAYPTISPPSQTNRAGKRLPEPALLLSVIRQESAFYVKAVSGANARGLMQILPSTAKGVARSLKIPFSPQRLTSDRTYNLTLGQAYLASLLDEFDGSYVLALAAYNAGPGRARQWIRNYGHPSESTVDSVDWVEMIPFTETRNYVQRVLENLQVYRAQLGATEIAENLEADLER